MNNYKETLVLNGYKKYDDGRNLLFVENNILNNFTIDKDNMIIGSEEMKLIFTYIIPNTNNMNQVNKIKNYCEKKYFIFADFNYKSNSAIYKNYIKEFYGEDTLQIGLIGKKPIKYSSISGPSDHYAIMYTIKTKSNYTLPLRIKEINIENSKKNIIKILKGQEADFRPNVKIIQRRCKFNDGENIIHKMLNDYVENNIETIYRKYNYLWKFNKKEPFLGTKCPENVVKTFAIHLREDKNKKYEFCKQGDNEEASIELNLKIKFTKSRALTNEYFSLGSIPEAINEFLISKKEWLNKNKIESNKDYNIINNVLNLANVHKEFLIANTFFLVKKPKLEDFNDVRMIVIIPTFIKIYETLIFDEIVKYLTEIIHEKGNYQFGGVIGGSTYEAIYTVRDKYINNDCKGILLCDMSKGYDTVNLQILREQIESIDNRRIRYLLLNWIILVRNMDIKMNEYVVKKTRGIAMGLSLSPIIFTFYVHKCISKFDVANFVMYIDDLCILIPKIISAEKAFEHINEVINQLLTFDLIINKSKTMLLSNDNNLIQTFENTFPCVQEDKYLGRELGINSDGFLIADDRFYNIKSSRVKAFPNFNIFGIKRILFVTALDAKNRYRFMCWSLNNQTLRGSVFRNNWFFFKGNNNKWSYIQMIFSMFNVFRFFIDSIEIDKLFKDYNNKIDYEFLNESVKNKLYTGIDVIDIAINDIKIKFEPNNSKNLMEKAKKFMDDIFEQIKENMIQDYVETKKIEGFVTYYNIKTAVKTRFFKNFVIFQNIIFNHYINEKNKQLFIFNSLDALYDKIKENIKFINKYKIKYINEKFTILPLKFKDLVIIKNYEDNKQWEKFIKIYNIKLWLLIDILVAIDDDLNNNKKSEIGKKMYKEIFKIFTIIEAITNNKNLNSTSVELLEYIFRAKCISLEELTDNFFATVHAHEEILIWDHDMLNI